MHHISHKASFTNIQHTAAYLIIHSILWKPLHHQCPKEFIVESQAAQVALIAVAFWVLPLLVIPSPRFPSLASGYFIER
jgi:hypothetical protein